MNACTVRFGVGFTGVCSGTPNAPATIAEIGSAVRCDFTGTGKMVYDAATVQGAFDPVIVLAPSQTLTLDLSGGLISPLNESIAGNTDFSGGVYALWVHHDRTSVSSGITVFGGAADEFQGPLDASCKATLAPKQGIAFIVEADGTGFTMSAAGARKIALTNLSATQNAKVRVYIQGKTE